MARNVSEFDRPRKIEVELGGSGKNGDLGSQRARKRDSWNTEDMEWRVYVYAMKKEGVAWGVCLYLSIYIDRYRCIDICWYFFTYICGLLITLPPQSGGKNFKSL